MPKRNRNYNRKRAQMNISGSSNNAGPSTPQNVVSPNIGIDTISVHGAPGQQGRKPAASTLADLQSRHDGHSLHYTPPVPHHTPLTSRLPDVRYPGLQASATVAETIRTGFPPSQNRFPTPRTATFRRCSFNANATPPGSSRNANTNGSNTDNTGTGGHTSSSSTANLNFTLGQWIPSSDQNNSSPISSHSRSASMPTGPSIPRVPPPAPRNISRTAWPNYNSPAAVPQHGSSNKENTPGSSAGGSGTETASPFLNFTIPSWGSDGFRQLAYPRLTGGNSGWEPVSQSRPIARDAHTRAHYRPAVRRISTEERSPSDLLIHPSWICQLEADVRNGQPSSSSTNGQAHVGSAAEAQMGVRAIQAPRIPDPPANPPAELPDNSATMSYEYAAFATVTTFGGSQAQSTDTPWQRPFDFGFNAPDLRLRPPSLVGRPPSLVGRPSSLVGRPPSLVGRPPSPFDNEFERVISTPPPRCKRAPKEFLGKSKGHSNATSASRSTPPVPLVSESENDEDSLRGSLNLRGLAEEASVLLEVYSRTSPGENEAENHDMIKAIFENVSRIWDKYKPKGTEDPVVEGKGKQKATVNTSLDDGCVIDAGCIVCCAQVADVVLMPCNHLILCTDCCDVMRIQKQGAFLGMSEKKLCPLCRATVHDRIKVFRG